jgi:hypothetical protein
LNKVDGYLSHTYVFLGECPVPLVPAPYKSATAEDTVSYAVRVAGDGKNKSVEGIGSVPGLTLTPFLVYLLEKVGDQTLKAKNGHTLMNISFNVRQYDNILTVMCFQLSSAQSPPQ